MKTPLVIVSAMISGVSAVSAFVLGQADKLDAVLASNPTGSVSDLAAAVREIIRTPTAPANEINWLMWSFVGLAVVWNPLIIQVGNRFFAIVFDAWERALIREETRRARARSQFTPRPPDLDKKDSRIAEFARMTEKQANE